MASAMPSTTRPYSISASKDLSSRSAPAAASCYPALGFKKPDRLPDSLDDWWCDPSDEYAFVGFSYEVTACKS